MAGKVDWAGFINKIYEAFDKKVNDMVYAAVMAAGDKVLPTSQFTKTGTLNKDTLITLVEDVQTANGVEAVIMGTKTALRALNALTKVDWADPASSIREAVANTGIIGNYEGTPLMEIPQKFTDKTLATPIVDNKKIYIMPAVDDRFIKFVDYGETELEVNEKGATQDDMQSYEVQRRMGVGTLMTRYHGEWTLD